MNKNSSVLIFILSTFTIYLLFSLLQFAFNIRWELLSKINLLSDLFSIEITAPIKKIEFIKPTSVTKLKPNYNFNLYQKPRFITNFTSDTTQPSLLNFSQKLYDLKKGKKRKIRIAYFGDSMIEGDLLTQTLRKLLQKEFGGSGVGFVPITSQVSQYRTTVKTNYSEGWDKESFKTPGKKDNLFISGYLFRGQNDWVEMIDQTLVERDSITLIEKSLLCGYMGQQTRANVNNKPFDVNATKQFNRILISKDLNRNLKFSIADRELPIYGITFESESGIIVDNFSFRGITGIEYSKIDVEFLQKISEFNPYDLIVFQYGVNLMFRPDDKNFNYYAHLIKPVITKIKSGFKGADFLIVSTADRAFRYGGTFKSAIGIDSLIKVQATLAYETESNFYNLYESMGGKNSIIDWATRKPSLANKDYVHPNNRGAEILGNYFFEALMSNYKKYLNSVH